MKKILLLFILIQLIMPAYADEGKLTVYTYDSFVSDWGPGPILEEIFEKECNCDIEFIGLTDAVEILSRVWFEGENTKADIILGLDNNLLYEAKSTGLFAKHALDLSNLVINDRFDDNTFVPYDYGYFSFIYDSSKIDSPPKSFEELIKSDNISVIIQDPRTSTPGLGLLLWIKSIYGDESDKIWQGLKDQILTVTPGWSEAYGLFLSGESDMVLSYTTSPAYHIEVEGINKYKAAKFIEGHYRQIEVAAKLLNTDNNKLADLFLDFLISSEAQSVLPETQWMYPVLDSLELLPDSFTKLISVESPLIIESKVVSKNRSMWIREWEKNLSQ